MNLVGSLHAKLGYEVVSWTSPMYEEEAQRPNEFEVSAPAGMKVVGGGYTFDPVSAGMAAESRPSADGSRWQVHVWWHGLPQGSVAVWAVCVSAE